MPDLQCVERVATGSEVELVVGDHVVEPGTDDAQRDGHGDHQLDGLLLPPRARQRRLAMTMPTRMPTMMHSAYARSGKPKISQTRSAGLGMKSRVGVRG